MNGSKEAIQNGKQSNSYNYFYYKSYLKTLIYTLRSIESLHFRIGKESIRFECHLRSVFESICNNIQSGL